METSKRLNNAERGIIYPRRGRNDPVLGPDVLMVMISTELTPLANEARAGMCRFSDMRLYHLYRTASDAGSGLAFAGPFLGAPQAVMGLEKLVALGASRIRVLGWCGSLQPHIRVGDVVVPTRAVSEEGTSAHYARPHAVPRPDDTLTGGLAAALTARGIPFEEGAVWTTDAVYRETPEKVRGHKERGVLAVEMELSALMTVAAYRRVALCAALVVSDELFELTWKPGFKNPLLSTRTRQVGRTLMALAADPEPLPQGQRPASIPGTHNGTNHT